MADATKIFLLWAGTTGNVPAGWSYESGFDGKFIRGYTTYGGTAGSDTHVHTISSPTCAPTGDTSLATAIGINVAHASHVHSLAALTCGNSTDLPPYRTLIVISNAANTTTIPTSVIAIFESAPSSGFSTYTDANSRYVRGGTPVGNGGAATHTHLYSGTTGNNDVSDDVQPDATPVAAHTHTHTVSFASATGNWRPPGVKVLLYSSDSNQNMPKDLVAFFNGDPPATWDIVSGIGTNYYQRLLYADVAFGTTGASHSHSVSGASDPPIEPSADVNDMLPQNTTTGPLHTHSISCTFATSAPVPAYINVIFAKFKGIEEEEVLGNMRLNLGIGTGGARIPHLDNGLGMRCHPRSRVH